MRKLCFVIPDPDAFQSGGNLYNAFFIDALNNCVVQTQVIDFEVFANELESISDSFCFIDTLFFNEIQQLPFELNNCFLIVHHLQSLELENPEAITFFESFEKPILNRFEGFLVSSEFTKNYLFENGLNNKKCLVVEPALCFSPQPKYNKSPKIKCLIVANLIKRKGILPFLEEIQKRQIVPKNIQIEIIGSPEFELDYARQCKKIIDDSPLSEYVHLAGSMDHQYIRKALSDANMYISSSFMETFGMALQEAVAFRLPILAIEKGNAKYHISNGKNGYLFSSMEALVDRLEFLSLNKNEFEALKKSSWDYRKKESYNWEKAAKQFLQQLKDNG